LAKLTHLLVVENNEETRTTVKCLFEMSGYRVTAVADEQGAAEACIVKGGHDLVLLNTNLPPPASFAAAYKTHRRPELRSIPMIFTSVDEHSIASMNNPEADDFTVAYITEVSCFDELEKLSECLLGFRSINSLV